MTGNNVSSNTESFLSSDSCFQAGVSCYVMSDLEVCRLHLRLLRHSLFSSSAFKYHFKNKARILSRFDEQAKLTTENSWGCILVGVFFI